MFLCQGYLRFRNWNVFNMMDTDDKDSFTQLNCTNPTLFRLLYAFSPPSALYFQPKSHLNAKEAGAAMLSA